MKRLLTAILLASVLAPAAPASPERVYFLHQNLQDEGHLYIYSAAEGTRVQMARLNIFLPASQPNALVYNPSNHKYCTLDQQLWLSKLAADNSVSSVQAVKTAPYHGHHATQYMGNATDSKGANRCRIEFWAAKDFNLPKKVQDDYSRLLGLPPGYGVPLCIIRHFPNGKNETFLATYGVQNSTLEAAELVPPKSGYQMASDEMDVLFGN